MAATLTQERFATPEWIFERKFDGIRLLAFKRGADVRLYSRNRLPQHLPAIADAVAALPIARRDSRRRGHLGIGGVVYHVFDVLWLDGRDVTALPLEDRRALLAGLICAAPLAAREPARRRAAVGARARAKGWEGVIAKRRGTPHTSTSARSTGSR